MTELVQALGQRGGLFTRWHIAAIVGAACACVLLAHASQSIDRSHSRTLELRDSLAILNQDRGTDVRSWIIAVHRLLPSLELVEPVRSKQAKEALENLTAQLANNELFQQSNQLRLRQALLAVEAQLKVGEKQLGVQRESYTHFYYWSLVFFLAIVAIALRGSLNLRKSALWQYRKDTFLFPMAPLAMALSDHNDQTIRTNEAFEKVTGFKESELQGRTVFDHEPEDMRKSLETTGVWVGEQKLRRKDGSEFSEKVLRLAVGDDVSAPEGYLTMSMETVVSDDERRLMIWQAHHDNLTKLPNSNLLHERLARGLTSAQDDKSERVGALISIDIDDFQDVNDSVGHELADRALTDAAYRIAMCARESDTVARMGGDLFMIAVFDIEQVAEAEKIAREAVDSFQAPFVLEDRELFLTASAGLTIFPTDGIEKGELLQKADAARIEAKKQGGNHIAFYEESMNSAAARRLEIETHLRRAIAQDELELNYQPIIDLSTGKIYGAEALLRWHSAELGFVSPAEFIPIAESCGMIVEVGAWVVSDVQRQLAVWQNMADWPELRISLNVSARQFTREEDADRLLDALTNCVPDQITIELTESALVTDDPGASRFLQGLKQQGMRIALDDFGTGYSSIGYLRDFDFDVLKIDKSFIDGLDNVKDYGLVASIVAMGRILGLKIVAEGVEDEDQVKHLQQIGCDYIQGYFYSKPLKVEDFESFVRGWDSLR
ncbi:MAG: EAL domain-containing protein [Pseudomonadales bacterium]|nr:EAL domain-containing protein [Pseudomonadales bacterium]